MVAGGGLNATSERVETRLLSNIVSVSTLLICALCARFYRWISPKRAERGRIKSDSRYTHTQALLLYLILAVMSVCLEMAEETGFNYKPATVAHF